LKYINQINLILVVVGSLIMFYTLSQTFWVNDGSEPIDLPITTPLLEESSRRSPASEVPVYQEAVTSRRQSVLRGPSSRTVRRPTDPGLEGDPQPEAAVGIDGRQQVQSSPQTPERTIRQVGRKPEVSQPVRDTAPGTGGAPNYARIIQQGSSQNRGTGNVRRNQAHPTARRPIGSEQDKRQTGDSPAPPPVRSSMAGRPPS
jgi:hypothetical protein